ncbi:MAG: monovalent cation/H+ antiporter subunit D family protein [Deltaproteobacteria bacterium]|nr:monovalent cation/H+ antiporter subunit D family protein [Deltaproteobacteria bacterium]
MENIVTDIRPLLAVLVSAVAVLFILMARKLPNLREGVSYVAAGIKFLLILSMVPVVLAGGVVEFTVFEVLPGIELKFRADALGMFFALTASFLWIIATTYSIGYMRSLNEHAQTRYFSCFAIALSAAIGVAFAGNLFTLYLFYELLSIMTYPLVAHHEDDPAWEGGTKYIVYLVGTSKTFLLAAVVMTYMITGTLEFKEGGIFTTAMPVVPVILTYIFFLIGFAKAGIMPLHNWLPSAMVAPTPVSGLLHAVAVVKVGVFSVVRIMLYVFGVEVMGAFGLGMATAFFVSFTIITASIIALTKDDLKARLAYSTVSQLSYIIIGVAMLTPSGITGGILHIACHAFSKITLFFCAGSIYVASGIKKISKLDGIARRMPITMAAFTIGAFSMIGVPVAAGFASKWYLAIGTLEAGSLALLMVLLVSTVLNAAYFLPIIFRAYFKEAPNTEEFLRIKETPFVWVPLSITAVISVIIGVYPDFLLSMIEIIVGNL